MNTRHLSAQPNFKNAKVVVIEDDDDHWFFIRRAMEQVLPEVLTERVTNATQALSLLQQWVNQEWEIPKLILLDLYLPTLEDGQRLLQQM